MEIWLQNETLVYKTGFAVTKCVSHLQNEIFGLQTGISDFNSSMYMN